MAGDGPPRRPRRAGPYKENRMLVLSRKRDESIVIADQIVVTVVEIRGDRVRLGVEAPRHIPVYRGEIHAAIKVAAEPNAAEYIEPGRTDRT